MFINISCQCYTLNYSSCLHMSIVIVQMHPPTNPNPPTNPPTNPRNGADSIYEMIFVGKGQCVDSNNVAYASFSTSGVTFFGKCASFCEENSGSKGLRGFMLNINSVKMFDKCTCFFDSISRGRGEIAKANGEDKYLCYKMVSLLCFSFG